MIPITKKTFGRSFKILIPGSVTIGDPSSLSALEALAAASCTSNDEIVLSNVLKIHVIICFKLRMNNMTLSTTHRASLNLRYDYKETAKKYSIIHIQARE